MNKKISIYNMPAEISCRSCLWYESCCEKFICRHFTQLQHAQETAEWSSEIEEFAAAWLDYIDEDRETEGHGN